MKRLLYKGIVFAGIILIWASCSTVSNITVSHVNNSPELGSSAFYALPQTVIDVNVVAEETRIIPGPYQKFAGKYLGIDNAPAKEEVLYQIKDISLNSHSEADPDFIYTVTGMTDPARSITYSSLLNDSLILPASDFAYSLVSSYQHPVKPDRILYSDLSVKRNFEVEKDVEISMVMPDTNYVSKPTRGGLKEKTQEQKAEEAANFLIKLKKRRFKLVAGQYDYMPEGESMASALKELERIEEAYLSLFIGKSIMTEIRRSYHYTPLSEKTSDRPILFRFSAKNGFVDARDSDGLPVILELESMHKTKELARKENLKPISNAFPYRIADQAKLKLLLGEQIWIEAILPVFQYGVKVSAGN